jgi:hypothetical protein
MFLFPQEPSDGAFGASGSGATDVPFEHVTPMYNAWLI